MTGSALNTDNRGIVIGMPLAESSRGVKRANSEATVFAVATDGAPPGGVVSYTTDGVVERSNWSLLAGTSGLVAGSTYYAVGAGGLGTGGSQAVGMAISGTQLRVNIGTVATPTPASAPAVEPIIVGYGRPSYLVGVAGQYYVDRVAKVWYGPKGEDGWVPFLTS